VNEPVESSEVEAEGAREEEALDEALRICCCMFGCAAVALCSFRPVKGVERYAGEEGVCEVGEEEACCERLSSE
jgi:hypothetical protein